jgi:uncharacterized membrane protein
MSLSPLLQATPAIQLHVALALLALILGAVVLFMRKGTALHRGLGRLWVGLMLGTALSSFFIHSINLFYGFSPIHLLSIVVLYNSISAVQAARGGRISAHRAHVVNLYAMALLGAGAFTVLPGRLMHQVLFGAQGGSGYLVMLAIILVTASSVLWGHRRSTRRERLRPDNGAN